VYTAKLVDRLKSHINLSTGRYKDHARHAKGGISSEGIAATLACRYALITYTNFNIFY
jgi:hypothetical protein